MLNIIWTINNEITVYLNNFILENGLEKIIWFLSDWPIFFLPIFLLSAWIFYTYKNPNQEKKENILYIFYSIVVGMIFNSISKLFIVEQRPDIAIKPILEHVPDNSFPSDHATVSFAFLFALYVAWYKKTFWFFIPFVILMNFSRIAGGLHWFFDIVVWAILWLVWTIIIFKNTKNKYIKKLNNLILTITKFIKL